MSLRISANLSPLQSPKSVIFLSIRVDALIWADDLATALRGLAAFAATRSAAAFFATFADFLDVLPAIAFTPGLRETSPYAGGGQLAPARPQPPRLLASLDVPGESVQDGLPTGALLLGGVRPLRVEGFPDGDAVACLDKPHAQGAITEVALDQLMGNDLRVCPGEVET